MLTNCHNRSAQSFRDTKKKREKEKRSGGGTISFQTLKMLGITLFSQTISPLETCQILPLGKHN